MDNDNLTSLQHLTDENVLLILEQRYKSNKIYTYSGHSLISINPYTKLPIYGQNVIYAYTEDNLNKENKSECKNEANETLFYPAQEAHIYSMAENAIKSLCITNKVTIIISGESGSGKTMNNNFILEYIIRRTNDFEVTNLNKNFNFKINEFLLAINPILEAFGNAKTILNENSSRFGKKLDLYLENDRIVGAEIFIYLLEKNRVTNVSKEEANFHIFNYFCAYKNLDVKSEFFNIEKDNENHKLKYKEILNCFKLLEFDDIESLENILLGIIYLGALKIKNCNDLYVIEKDENFFNCINFLEIEEQQLIFFLLKTEIKTPLENFIKNNTYEIIVKKRNTFARHLYSMLFNQLVSIFNKKIHTTKQNYKTITVLDIYGFENFDKNSFDQFCINWANEKIQDDFVKRMFVDLQKMYKEEGIIIDDIDYTHNGCLDVFERSCGIVDLINEESCNSFGSIDNLKTKINNYCKEIKVSKKEFLIKHYASDVSYCADDFLDKNNEVGLDYEEIFKGKNAFNNYFLNQICNNKTKDLFKKPTQLKYFKKSLDDLFESLSDSKILYVRCLKPNKKKTNSFDQDYILKQLKSSGIIETIEISKKTYSHYIYIEDFNQRYMTLTKNYNIIKGKNGVFMSNETLNMIEKEREELILLQKEIITGVLLSNFYHKKIQEDLKIVRNFVKLFVINFKKEKIQKENTKIKSDEEKLKFELENLLNEENLNFKQDKNFALNHPNLDFKNVLDCLPEKSESDIIFNDNESNDQIKKFTYKNVSNYSFLLRDKSEIDDFRFDNNEISFIGDSILVKGEQGERYMVEENLNYEKIREGDKENLILDLQNKLKKYELFYKTPCRNCKNMEIKYKFQTEELKRKKLQELEVENYKKKIKDLEESIQKLELNCKNLVQSDKKINDLDKNENIKKQEQKKSPLQIVKTEDFTISFTSPYDVFGCLIELFLDFYPIFSSSFLPKNEALAFSHVLFQTIKKLNKKGNDFLNLTEMLMNEIRERFASFERNVYKLSYVISNIIELRRIFSGENSKKAFLTSSEISFIYHEIDEIITILFKHLCEMFKQNILEFLPDSVILYQGLKEFHCKERYFSKFFGSISSIKKLIDALEYTISVLNHYHLPEQAWEECINYLLKTINCRCFNGIIVKNDFLSFNRGMQLNNNLNEIERFCREIGYSEGIMNLEHLRGVIKLINFVKAGLNITNILDRCSFLNTLQIIELLGKFKKDEREYLKKEIGEFVLKDVTLDKFVCESVVNVFIEYTGVEFKFLVPRYVPSKYIQAIIESL